jgi:hypothetical protein
MKLFRHYSVYSLLALAWLAGCGDSSSAPINPPPPTIGRIYVSKGNENLILRFNAGATGDASPQARLATGPNDPNSVAVDVLHDRLAATSANSAPSVDILDNVSGAGSPLRVISGAATTLKFPLRCAFDGPNDVVYVSDNSGTTLLVFGPASTVSGNVAPLRTVTTSFSFTGMALDAANNRLFLSDFSHNAIAIFDGASTLNGPVVPTRVISGTTTQLNAPDQLVLDSSGRLIVSGPAFNGGSSSLLVFANAGTANGNVAPATSSLLDRHVFGMAISSTGELYVADAGTEVPVYGNIATANGAINPIRVIAGPDTGLGFPQPGVPPLTVGIAFDPTR